MKNSKILVFITLMLVGMSSAHAGVSANVALTTDYVWRGVSQNKEDPALQGGFDYSHDTGFYAGVWGSNVSFGEASTELDFYGGWASEFDNGFDVDLGYIKYSYHGSPAAGDNDFQEAYVGLGHSGFSVQYSFGDELDDHWQLGYETSFKKVDVSATFADYDTYQYYRIGVAGDLQGTGWALDFWDTDDDDDDLFSDYGGSRLVFTLSKEFE